MNEDKKVYTPPPQSHVVGAAITRNDVWLAVSKARNSTDRQQPWYSTTTDIADAVMELLRSRGHLSTPLPVTEDKMESVTLREAAQDLLKARERGPHISERLDLWRALEASLQEVGTLHGVRIFEDPRMPPNSVRFVSRGGEECRYDGPCGWKSEAER